MNPFLLAGITITSIESPQAGPGLTLTDWQSDNLLRMAHAGQGSTGSQVRRQFPMPDTAMPLDLIVAAWVLEGASPISKLAQPLMPTLRFDDPSKVVIPDAVLVLFTHEAMTSDADGTAAKTLPARQPVFLASPTRKATASVHPRMRSQPDLRPTLAGGDLCSVLLSLQATVLNLVFDALGGKDTFLGQKAQVAIGLLAKAAAPFHIPDKGALDVLMTLGFVASLVGSVSPWTVSIVADEDPIAYGIAPAVGNRGTVHAVVDPGPVLKWPEALKSCAQLLNITLPEISPVGGIVTWTPTLSSHATQVSQDGVIMDINGRYEAKYLYDTSVEPTENATGTQVPAVLLFEAKVDRPGNETFDKLISGMIGRYAGDGIIGTALQYLTEGLTKTITDMSNPDPALKLVTVTFHLPPDPKAPPTGVTVATEGPPAGTSGGCIGVDLFSQQQANMAAGVRLNISPQGTLIFDFTNSQPTTSNEGGVEVTIQLSGSLTGSYKRTENVFVTSPGAVNLGGSVTVMGTTSPLPPEAFAAAAALANDESLTCGADGSVTVKRTGQIYR